MRLVASSVATLSAALLFVQCVGSEPAATDSYGNDGGSSGDGGGGTPTPTDGSSGTDDASADAPCGAGLATCGGGPSCGTKLTEDPLHCGACGHACMGGDCLGGQCQPQLLASGFPLPANYGQGLASDNENLYFATQSRVYKVSKTPTADAGGAAVMLHEATLAINYPRYVTVENGAVWWTSDGAGASTGKVWKMLRDGAPGDATSPVTAQNHPAGIGVDGTFVFWTTDGTAAQDQGIIRRAPAGGGSTTDVITGQISPRHLLVSSGRLYWDLGISNNNVLYTATKTPGSTPSTVLDLADDHVAAFALTSTKLYWVTYNKGALWRASIDGQNAEKLHTGTSNGISVAVDDNGLFASFAGTFSMKYKDSVIVQVNAPTGQTATTKTIATLPFVQGIAIDADFIYAVGGDYPTADTGKLWRIRR